MTIIDKFSTKNFDVFLRSSSDVVEVYASNTRDESLSMAIYRGNLETASKVFRKIKEEFTDGLGKKFSRSSSPAS